MWKGEHMRAFLLAVSATFAFAAPTDAATRNFGITGFEKVRIDGPFNVSLKTGVAPFARASGSPAALDGVAIEVRGNTLVVHNNLDSWSGYPGKDVGPVEISLGSHDLSAAWLNGSGALSIDRIKALSFDLSVQGSGIVDVDDVEVDQLNVSIVGTASATLGGHAGKMTALVRGVSTLDAGNLATKDAALGAEGTATVKANVVNSVTVDSKGPATVRLTGGPACTLKVSGSTTVSGCR
jgi:hypothetical protein